ncbi:MAG: ankyrin repeat domain-containing protein, partial [Treponema sp.]|nr:ankyrin repeat domain-containing protein [Treponema sp.]
NARNQDGETPLIVAAMKGQNDLAALLIDHGADPNAVDNLQHSALYYAAEGGYTEITERLITAGGVW